MTVITREISKALQLPRGTVHINRDAVIRLFKGSRPEFKEYMQQVLKNAKALCSALTKMKFQLILVRRCENSRYVYVSPAEALRVGSLRAAGVTVKKVNPRLLSCRCCPLNTPSTPIPTHSRQPNYLPCMVTCSR